MAHFNVVIPARWESSRFPGKPLAPINGKPMILHVAERAIESGANKVVVATDDVRILDCVSRAGHMGIMIDDDCASGTDRVALAVDFLGWGAQQYVINVQGDEPLINPEHIKQLYMSYLSHSGDMFTLCSYLMDEDSITNPNIVKVVMDYTFRALYFSRASIPFARDWRDRGYFGCYRHIGIYGYKVSFLRKITKFDPVAMEEAEQLEQLRALWYGFKIRVDLVSETAHPGVDTPEDLIKINELIEK